MKRIKKLNKKQWIALVVVICCVIFVAGYFGYREYARGENSIHSNGNIQEIESENTVTYDGKKYTYNEDLKAILFLGVDKREEVQVQTYTGRGGQSDCILLLVMNKKEKTTTLLQVSRDSMVDLKIYDSAGELLTTERGQLALQYAYGDGEKKSCRLTRDAVSNLLFGIPIDGYISMNIDGITAIVEALGGVDITFEEDYTELDTDWIKGATVTLYGAQAERFVRYRDTKVMGSNNLRMERQIWFLRALFSQVKERASGNPSLYDTLLDAVSPYMVSDLTAEEMKALSDYQMEEEIEKVPGEVQSGEKHDEYIVDDEKLFEILLKVFYKLKK